MASKAPDLSQSTMDLESRIALITYGKGTMPPQKGILDAATISMALVIFLVFSTDLILPRISLPAAMMAPRPV